MRNKTVIVMAVAALFGLYLMSGGGVDVGAEEGHKDKNAFHADVAHSLLDMHTTLNMISAYRAKNAMPPDRDKAHEQAAHGFKHALELFGVGVQMAHEGTQEGKDKFHAEVAHALLEMNLTLDLIKTYRVSGKMPSKRDEVHEKAAHGFKHALELFGVKVEMKHKDKNKFHGDVAHALLGMSTTLDQIAVYRAEESMPPNRDEVYEQAAHGFKHALELFGVKIRM